MGIKIEAQNYIEEKDVTSWEHKILKGLNAMIIYDETCQKVKDRRQHEFLKFETKFHCCESIARKGLSQPNNSNILLGRKIVKQILEHLNKYPKEPHKIYGLLVWRKDKGNFRNYVTKITFNTKKMEDIYNMITNHKFDNVYDLFRNQPQTQNTKSAINTRYVTTSD